MVQRNKNPAIADGVISYSICASGLRGAGYFSSFGFQGPEITLPLA
jgi:hypothetical protein